MMSKSVHFEEGYSEAAILMIYNPRFRRSGRAVLERLGILPSEAISDEYDIWNPAADRTTELRFNGDHHAFYEFYDGANAAVDDIAGRLIISGRRNRV